MSSNLSEPAAKVLKKLDQAGLLDAGPFGAMSWDSVKKAAAMAVESEEGEDGAVAELQNHLKELHRAASTGFELMTQKRALDWKMTSYRITEEARERQQSGPSLSESQETFTKHKQSRELADEWNSLAAKKNRHDACDRIQNENDVRSKLASRALAVMLRSGLVGTDGVLGRHAEKALHTRLLKGLRARTLRLRIQSAERAARWLAAARNGKWFLSPDDFEEYLSDISTQKGVGVSTYERARYGILYLEAAAGTRSSDCISLSLAVKATIHELELQTSSDVQATKKQAPQLLSSMLIKLEALVINEEEPTYQRAYAWLKLVCFWNALRGDDATWIKPKSLRYDQEFGMQGELLRTKSTGPGKNILSRPIVIGNGAYFENKAWCRIGMVLWDSGDKGRQNFLLFPGHHGEIFRPEGAEPADRAALTRIIFREYCLWPAGEIGCPRLDIRLVASRFWTEHSSRASLPTMARAVGIDKAITDKIGCWTTNTTTSDEYIRCGREQVTKAQCMVAAKVREAVQAPEKNNDIFGENGPDDVIVLHILNDDSSSAEKPRKPLNETRG